MACIRFQVASISPYQGYLKRFYRHSNRNSSRHISVLPTALTS
ncbi:hypothetical protein EIKCOROL_00485 [Eikenella corrodens ATCC 23834]|uniref:Uncharacterized protein n=1 Tax=Eikenella corrodens ATCC 23834 TaxID=546274 RepID=C0DT11_EIKCO|nr:hypothetical protein EIKCOROL_00485 [Eikenella corrodens ATCC 23834]